MQIAGKLTIQNWKELSKNLYPENDDNWGLAFHFFEERIRTRYLNPIHAILDLKDNLGEGFAVVNLQCSLIETIESFINGWIYHIDKESDISNGWYLRKTEGINRVKNPLDQKVNLKNEDIFISFLKKREPFNTMDIEGLDFYKFVRCGLLHETQTKNGWKILADGFDKSINDKIIYRNDFQRDLQILIEEYKKAIINGVKFCDIESIDLRKNFKAKFDNICNES